MIVFVEGEYEEDFSNWIGLFGFLELLSGVESVLRRSGLSDLCEAACACCCFLLALSALSAASMASFILFALFALSIFFNLIRSSVRI